MLHEVLLSLMGHASPLLQDVGQIEPRRLEHDEFAAFTPTEQALVGKLGHLSQLHIQLKDQAACVSSSHTSVVCRAVSSRIVSQYLKLFRQKVLDVESSILAKDARYVGGYDIVPLSTVCGEFAPWVRRLEWLFRVTNRMFSRDPGNQNCSGATIIDFLRLESHTGYIDLAEMADDLVRAAEMAWLRQLSSWLLHGKLPVRSAGDFFIQAATQPTQSSKVGPVMVTKAELAPGFVTAACAESILFIGNSLNQIWSWSRAFVDGDPTATLVPAHLELLKTLVSPISSLTLSNVISSVRRSISQNALCHLLPMSRIMDILSVLQCFFLLGHGEFAVSLVSQADKQVRSRLHAHDSSNSVRKAGRLENIIVKRGEVGSVLSQTWAELLTLRGDDRQTDHTLSLGMEMVQLDLEHVDAVHSEVQQGGFARFTSLLLPSPTVLKLVLPSDSPLNLFISSVELREYSTINSYLLSIRRADMHLGALWKLTSLRRSCPHQRGPPRSSTRVEQRKSLTKRGHEGSRARKMRDYWASASKALFVIKELASYLQVDVVKQQWDHFHAWLEGQDTEKNAQYSKSTPPPSPVSTGSVNGTKDLPSSSRPASKSKSGPHCDLATLSQAHGIYLRKLAASLLLTKAEYTGALQKLLISIDQFCALFGQLEDMQQAMDLRDDHGARDASASYVLDENDILEELERCRTALEQRLVSLVDVVRGIDEAMMQARPDLDPFQGSFNELGLSGPTYRPPNQRTLERLVMKLEFVAGERSDEEYLSAHGEDF